MFSTRILALAALAVPLVASAQIYYEGPLNRGEFRACIERDAALYDRLAVLDNEKIDNDRESDSIARSGDQLAQELRRLDSRDQFAVAEYNARSAEHNRRVDLHNRRVADMNSRAARFNNDSAYLTRACSTNRYYNPREREYIRIR